MQQIELNRAQAMQYRAKSSARVFIELSVSVANLSLTPFFKGSEGRRPYNFLKLQIYMYSSNVAIQ